MLSSLLSVQDYERRIEELQEMITRKRAEVQGARIGGAMGGGKGVGGTGLVGWGGVYNIDRYNL